MAEASSPRQTRLHQALSNQQEFALLEEVSSARNLLRDCITAIQDMRNISWQGDAVFTLGSIGVEKTMKVMLGVHSVEAEGKWPTQEKLKGWGHDIEKLNSDLSKSIGEGLPNTTSRGYATTLAERIRNSQTLPLIFETFNRYGKSGRFHHLDILATDKPNRDMPAADYWDRVERMIQATVPEFRCIPTADNDAFEQYGSRLRRSIAHELEVWWFCIHRLGVQGCFGELGKRIGWEIWDSERTAPSLGRD